MHCTKICILVHYGSITECGNTVDTEYWILKFTFGQRSLAPYLMENYKSVAPKYGTLWPTMAHYGPTSRVCDRGGGILMAHTQDTHCSISFEG